MSAVTHHSPYSNDSLFPYIQENLQKIYAAPTQASNTRTIESLSALIAERFETLQIQAQTTGIHPHLTSAQKADFYAKFSTSWEDLRRSNEAVKTMQMFLASFSAPPQSSVVNPTPALYLALGLKGFYYIPYPDSSSLPQDAHPPGAFPKDSPFQLFIGQIPLNVSAPLVMWMINTYLGLPFALSLETYSSPHNFMKPLTGHLHYNPAFQERIAELISRCHHCICPATHGMWVPLPTTQHAAKIAFGHYQLHSHTLTQNALPASPLVMEPPRKTVSYNSMR